MCAFISAFRSQNALFETKKIKCVFGNGFKSRFLKKVAFSNVKDETLMYGQLSAAFAKAKTLLINITVGSEGQLPNCPHILLKTKFYHLINQRITPSL